MNVPVPPMVETSTGEISKAGPALGSVKSLAIDRFPRMSKRPVPVAPHVVPVPSTVVKPPRIAESPVHIECMLEQIIELGDASTDLVIGRCVRMHVDPAVQAEDGRIDALKLRPLSRLGRDEYAVVDSLIRYPRPTV